MIMFGDLDKQGSGADCPKEGVFEKMTHEIINQVRVLSDVGQ